MEDLRWPTYGPRNKVLTAAELAGDTGSLYVRDDGGQVYLDAVAGIGCVPQGHAHPKWVRAVSEQLGRLVASANTFWTEPQQALARRLIDSFPLPDARVFFCNTGTEATEAAIKLVLRATGRDVIIAFERAFHGRTLGAIALTANPRYRDPYVTCLGEKPTDRFATANVIRARFGDLDTVRSIFAEYGSRVAAVFVEPIQGEAGVYPASREFLIGLRRLCSDHGALLGADEIQAGFGRTGHLAAWTSLVGDDPEHQPDLLWLAKALGGGYPIGACLARRELAESMQRGSHGTTFGGNPAACVAALATLDILEEEDLLRSAAAQLETLRGIAARKPHPAVAEIRGRGAMIGIDIAGDNDQPAAALATAMMDEGVLVTVCGGRTVRLLLPYRAGAAELEKLWDALGRALEKTADSRVG